MGLDRAQRDELIHRYSAGPARLRAALGAVPGPALKWRPAPGMWSAHEVVCLSCDERAPMQRALDRVAAGEADPPCRTCGGILKAAVISFGQHLVVADLERAFAAAASCDLLIAVGTSLGVYPIAEVVPTALANGAALLIVNAEPTPFDPDADVVLRGSISEVLPIVVGAGT